MSKAIYDSLKAESLSAPRSEHLKRSWSKSTRQRQHGHLEFELDLPDLLQSRDLCFVKAGKFNLYHPIELLFYEFTTLGECYPAASVLKGTAFLS